MENITYNEVPNIITGKDLDYLSDMFNWNYGALKSNINAMDEVEDMEIENIIEEATHVFNNNINTILNLLSSGGQNE